MFIIQCTYHRTGLNSSEDTMSLARAVNAEIGRGGHVHPDSEEELQVASALASSRQALVIGSSGAGQPSACSFSTTWHAGTA